MSFSASNMDVFVEVGVEEIVHDLLKMVQECDKRGLKQSGLWAAELLQSLYMSKPKFNIDLSKLKLYYMADEEIPKYSLAKCHFDLEEYDQASYFAKETVSSAPCFLHYYSIFCSGEKKRLDDVSESSFHVCPRGKNKELPSLCAQLRKLRLAYKLDGFMMYLYGVVLKKMQLDKEAVDVFVEAVTMEPLNWGAWDELSILITDFEMLADMQLPNHWMKNFFLAHTYLELQLNDIAMKFYDRLCNLGFATSTYIAAQKAIAYHNMRSLDKAIVEFKNVSKMDPYRLDNLDIYSNLLYVKGKRAELGELAVKACKLDRYRVETNCVIGNFYSLRGQHTKAVLYFQRASQLNPNYLSAWTLMGHEYMEMKNTSFAIQAYRQAIDVNRRDYRAWYGLGQTYEVLKMPFYCLYYYKQAQQLRPHDSRMIVALGESYEKLEKYKEAKRCYWKAHAVGNVEGIALLKLAKLQEMLNEEEQAVLTYTEYCKGFKAKTYTDREAASIAHLFLARYHLKKSEFDLANSYAEVCTGFPEVREDARSLMRQISNRQFDSSVLNVDFKVPLEIWNTSAEDES